MTDKPELFSWVVLFTLCLVFTIFVLASRIEKQGRKETSNPIKADASKTYIGYTDNVDFDIERDCEYYKSILELAETKKKNETFVSAVVKPVKDGVEMTIFDSVIYCDCEFCKWFSKYLKRFGGQDDNTVEESKDLPSIPHETVSI